MKFFPKMKSPDKSYALVALLFAIAALSFALWSPYSYKRISKQEASKSSAVQAEKKLTEDSLKMEAEWRKRMLNESADFETRFQAASALAETQIKDAVERCADYKKRVYSSNIDPQVKDLLWGVAVIASGVCWEVDAQAVPISTAKSKTAKSSKPKAQGLK